MICSGRCAQNFGSNQKSEVNARDVLLPVVNVQC